MQKIFQKKFKVFNYPQGAALNLTAPATPKLSIKKAVMDQGVSSAISLSKQLQNRVYQIKRSRAKKIAAQGLGTSKVYMASSSFSSLGEKRLRVGQAILKNTPKVN